MGGDDLSYIAVQETGEMVLVPAAAKIADRIGSHVIVDCLLEDGGG